jgi:hypothetical protein
LEGHYSEGPFSEFGPTSFVGIQVQSKAGIFRDFGVAEAPPGFQAGWSDSGVSSRLV